MRSLRSWRFSWSSHTRRTSREFCFQLRCRVRRMSSGVNEVRVQSKHRFFPIQPRARRHTPKQNASNTDYIKWMQRDISHSAQTRSLRTRGSPASVGPSLGSVGFPEGPTACEHSASKMSCARSCKYTASPFACSSHLTSKKKPSASRRRISPQGGPCVLGHVVQVFVAHTSPTCTTERRWSRTRRPK